MRTDITPDEAREVLWASSEEGKAQLAAAWAKAIQLGLDSRRLTGADVGALLWAAHETGPDRLCDPRRVRARELFAGGENTITSVYGQLAAEGTPVSRETLHRWVVEGRWRVKR